MGKTTLCNAITGLVPASGSVRLAGEEILGLPPNAITDRGRRLRAAGPARLAVAHGGRAPAPGLARPRAAPGRWRASTRPSRGSRSARATAAPSSPGGEQQMLAIARALLFNPILLVMDEPTEGLAPVIVQQVAEMLKHLAADGEISVLLIEQNLGVAIDVADTVDVMVNGRIARSMPVGRAGRRPRPPAAAARREGGRRTTEADDELGARTRPARAEPDAVTVYTVRRSTDDAAPAAATEPEAAGRARGARLHALERGRSPERAARPADRRQRADPGDAAAVARRRRRPRWPRAAAPRGSSSSRWPPPSGAPPTSPAPSTPRGASCSSCATAWRSSGCAPSRSTSRPPASRRRR